MTRLRSSIFFAYMAIVTTIMGIACLPILLFGENAGRAAIAFWARVILSGLRIICGISYRIEGRDNIPSGGAIVATNHQSMWETIAFFAILKRPVMVFKRELMRVPVYRWWGLGGGGGIAIDRNAGASAMRNLMTSARDKLEAGGQVIILPEGTRVAVGQTVRLQPGVAGIYLTAKVPCVPVAHDSGRFWRHPGGLKVPGIITMRFLPAIPAGLDKKVFMARLEQALIVGRPDLDAAAEERDHFSAGAAAAHS